MSKDTMGKTEGVGLIVYGGTNAELQAKLRRRDDRITDLEAALRNLVADCDDYAKINNLAGTWATIERARALLVQ